MSIRRRQIEFAKLYLTNVVTGKRYIKKLVEEGIVDGWDDPRLVSIAALRRRGFTPESIKMFVDLCGVSKANSSVDYAMLEYCIREDLKMKTPRMMAVLDPIKLVIDNYPEGQVEYLDCSEQPGKRGTWQPVRFRSAESFILSERTSWRSRRRNISVCSRAMRYV
ncbi:MAG: glutamate--tRNA ligase family protein [Lachnospiraceae bacterium]